MNKLFPIVLALMCFGFIFSKSSMDLFKEEKRAIIPSIGISYQPDNKDYSETLGITYLSPYNSKIYFWYNKDSDTNGLYFYHYIIDEEPIYDYFHLKVGFDYYKSNYYKRYTSTIWWGIGLTFPVFGNLNFSANVYQTRFLENDNWEYWDHYLGFYYIFADNLNIFLDKRFYVDDAQTIDSYSIRISYDFILNKPNNE